MWARSTGLTRPDKRGDHITWSVPSGASLVVMPSTEMMSLWPCGYSFSTTPSGKVLTCIPSGLITFCVPFYRGDGEGRKKGVIHYANSPTKTH